MNKKFVLIFTFSFFALLSSYILLFEVANPHATGILGLEMFRPWHVNLEYEKFSKLRKASSEIETLVVGSSTSEAFVMSDLDSIFSTKSYIVSLGGADTATRNAVIKKALIEMKGLKHIIYVADFFEFNKSAAKPEVAFQEEMGKLISKSSKPDLISFLKYYFSNQSFEDSFNVFKRKQKRRKLSVNVDGTMNQSMVLSPLKSSGDFKEVFTHESEKKKLLEQVIENYQTYSKSVLKGMKQLNPDVMDTFKSLVRNCRSAEVKISFIMVPYQFNFRNYLFKDSKVEKNYQDWGAFMHSFEDEENVKVLDERGHFIAAEPMSTAWRDGIHFNRSSAYSFLIDLKIMWQD